MKLDDLPAGESKPQKSKFDKAEQKVDQLTDRVERLKDLDERQTRVWRKEGFTPLYRM